MHIIKPWRLAFYSVGFIILFKRESVLTATGSLPQCPTQLGLSQSKAKNLELNLVLPNAWLGSKWLNNQSFHVSLVGSWSQEQSWNSNASVPTWHISNNVLITASNNDPPSQLFQWNKTSFNLIFYDHFDIYWFILALSYIHLDIFILMYFIKTLNFGVEKENKSK